VTIDPAALCLYERYPKLFQLASFSLPEREDAPVVPRLRELATLCGIHDVSVRPLAVQALLVDKPRLEVWLNQEDPRTVRNFSLAHEIGHVLIGMPHNPLSSGPVVEERCERIARQIVTPPPAVAEVASQSGASLTVLFSLARQFDVSRHTMAASIVSDGSWNVVILLWTRKGRPGSGQKKIRPERWWKRPGQRIYIPDNLPAPPFSNVYRAYTDGHARRSREKLRRGTLNGMFETEAIRLGPGPFGINEGKATWIWEMVHLD